MSLFSNKHCPEAPIHVSNDETFDEILAKNSALSFLCRVNADYKEVERYLSAFPEALLFGTDYDSSTETVILDQMQRCACFSKACKQNRRLVLRAIRRGFEFYRGVRLVNCEESEYFRMMEKRESGGRLDQLRKLERELRILKQQEKDVENQVARASQALSVLRYQMETMSKRVYSTPLQSQLLKLKCRKVNPHVIEARATLENKLAAATIAISSLERELKLLRVEIGTTLRLRFDVLKKSFQGCRRHICNASRLEI